MKILLVTYFGLEQGGGIATATKMLAEELTERGHQITIAATEKFFPQNNENEIVWEKLPKIRQIPDLNWRDKILSQRLKKIIGEGSFDLIHVTDVRFMAVAVLKTTTELELAGQPKIPVLIDYRDYWFNCLKGDLLFENCRQCAGMNDLNKCRHCLGGEKFGWQQHWMDHKFNYFHQRLNWLKKADRHLPVSQCVADKMTDFGLVENVSVIYDTIIEPPQNKITLKSVSQFRTEQKWQDKVLIMFAGKLIYHRGIKTILKVAQILQKKKLPIEIVLIGDGEMMVEATQEKARLKLKQVRLLGQIESEAMPLYLAASDIFFFPSMFDEPFSRAVLEAVFAEKPVVASNLGGLKEVIIDGETGFLVDPHHPYAVAEKLEKLIKSPKLRAEMAMATRKEKKRFAAPKYFQKLEKIYQEVSRQHA